MTANSEEHNNKVAYIWSKEYEETCDHLPSNIGRVTSLPSRANSQSSRIHSLIRAYELDKLMKHTPISILI